MLNVMRQDPSALLDYRIDWSQYLEEDDTITASTWASSPSGLTLACPAFTDATTTNWGHGWNSREALRDQNHITTEGARVDERTFTVAVVNL